MFKKSPEELLWDVAGFVFALIFLFMFLISVHNTFGHIINRGTYQIQNNTETVLIDGKECVIYDDNSLFGSASISCDWGDNDE